MDTVVTTTIWTLFVMIFSLAMLVYGLVVKDKSHRPEVLCGYHAGSVGPLSDIIIDGTRCEICLEWERARKS